MPGPAFAAPVFAAVTALVVLFQLALAAGAPWGQYAMGGAFPGVMPAGTRAAAVVQAVVLLGMALVVLCRAGRVLPGWGRAARWPTWGVTVLMGLSLILNLITPSPMERMIWAPVVAVLFALALRVALARD